MEDGGKRPASIRCESLDADDAAGWEAELARRAEEIRSGQAQGVPAEQVLAELRKKYS
jgi:putative addiction module component (TIGR02574 family)